MTDPISPYPFGSLESLKKRIPISLALLSEVAPQKKKLKLIVMKNVLNVQALVQNLKMIFIHVIDVMVLVVY